MSTDLSEQLDKAEKKRKKQQLYLNIRDICITVILTSAVVSLIYYIATRSGYAS